jgi:hypothetical protein
MSKIRWREVFTFLSGAALAGSPGGCCPWLTRAFPCFFGYPRLPGLRAAVQFVR